MFYPSRVKELSHSLWLPGQVFVSNFIQDYLHLRENYGRMRSFLPTSSPLSALPPEEEGKEKYYFVPFEYYRDHKDERSDLVYPGKGMGEPGTFVSGKFSIIRLGYGFYFIEEDPDKAQTITNFTDTRLLVEPEGFIPAILEKGPLGPPPIPGDNCENKKSRDLQIVPLDKLSEYGKGRTGVISPGSLYTKYGRIEITRID